MIGFLFSRAQSFFNFLLWLCNRFFASLFLSLVVGEMIDQNSVSELLKGFVFKKVLQDDDISKSIDILGTINGKDAILKLEKTIFNKNLVEKDLVNSYIGDVHSESNNDIYFWGLLSSQANLANLPSSKYSLIYPATETHIKKYQKSNFHMVRETPEAYEKVVKPYIQTMLGDRLKWVKNILYDGAEAKRVLFKNDDYIILPDMKWDGKDVQSLYCCCVVYDDSILSIRSLNNSHIDYLTRIRDSILKEIPAIYAKDGITSDQLRLYVHYQPSYYHFHIHIVNVDHTGHAGSMFTGKAILLDDIIDNLSFLGEQGFSQRTLSYQIKDTHDLWSLGMSDYAI